MFTKVATILESALKASPMLIDDIVIAMAPRISKMQDEYNAKPVSAPRPLVAVHPRTSGVMSKLGRLLSARGRRRVAMHNFALPETCKYPIHDISHARNALSRVAQYGTPEQIARVRRAVHSKYPALAGS